MAQRCNFIDKQGQDFIDKIKQFISMLNDSLTSKELSRQLADEAVYQAIRFFNQPLPTISENSKPADVDNNDSSPASDFRDDISELKKDVSNLTQTMLQEKDKNMTHRKKYKKLLAEGKRKETAYLLSMHVLEKKLSSMRKLVRRNYERQKMDVPLEWDCVEGDATSSNCPTQGATTATNVSQRSANDKTPADISTVEEKLLAEPAGVELKSLAPARPPQTILDVELRPITCHMVKTPGETTTITDFKCVNTRFFVAKQGSLDEFFWTGRIARRVAQLENCKISSMSHTMIAASHLQEVVLFSAERGYWMKMKTLFKCPEMDEILAIAFLSSNSIAVATTTNVVILDFEKRLLGKIEIQKPLIDMFRLGDDYLVLWDSQRFTKINIHLGKPVKEVAHKKSFCSLSNWRNGNFFALDSVNKTLYLFGPDMETIHQKWLLGNQLRDEDQLLRVSVVWDDCLCVTKFGFVYHFKIEMKNAGL